MARKFPTVPYEVRFETQTRFLPDGSIVLTPHCLSQEEWSLLFNNKRAKVLGTISIQNEQILIKPLKNHKSKKE